MRTMALATVLALIVPTAWAGAAAPLQAPAMGMAGPGRLAALQGAWEGAVGTWAAAGGPAGAMAPLALAAGDAAFGLAGQAGGPAAPRAEQALRALAPVLGAQRAAAQALAGSALPPDGLEGPLGFVARAEALADAPSAEAVVRFATGRDLDLRPGQPWDHLAREALRLQEPLAPALLPEVPRHASFTAAVEALARLHGQPLGAPQHAALAEFEALPPGLLEALQRLVEASLFAEQAARLAAGRAGPLGVDVALLAAARAPIVAEVALAAPRLTCHPGGPVLESQGLVSISTTCSGDTYTKNYRLQVDLGGNDLYRNNAGGSNGSIEAPDTLVRTYSALLVDALGSDIYLGDASTFHGKMGGGFFGLGALFDLGGDDSYVAGPAATGNRSAVLGGGHVGAGLLVDAFGDDVYAITTPPYVAGEPQLDEPQVVAAGGAAVDGVGLLLDADSGADWFEARLAFEGAAFGAALSGSGLLVSGGGPDAYTTHLDRGGAAHGAAGIYGTLAAHVADLGVLLDLGEDSDSYAVHGGPGGTVIANGAAHVAGTGLLLDFGGDETYHAARVSGDGLAAHGAAYVGTGILADLGGQDGYNVTAPSSYGAVNGAALVGQGLLLDTRFADDTYEAVLGSGVANGAAAFGGTGVLLDDSGLDTYLASLGAPYAGERGYESALNGAAHGGVGVLRDGFNHNTFVALSASGLVPSHGAARGMHVGGPLYPPVVGIPLPVSATLPSVGILVGGLGDDAYISNGITQGAATGYAAGLLLDLAGTTDVFVALAPAFAQGAGRDLGAGLLLAGAAIANLTLDPGATGQGAGQLGVGLAFHAGQGGGSYLASLLQFADLVRGAGVGSIIDAGVADIQGRTPGLLQCDSRTVMDTNTFDLCAPDEGTSQAVVDPVTGEPVGALPKPAFACTDPIVPPGPAQAACQEAFVRWEANLGDDPDAWVGRDHVEVTMSGGLLAMVAYPAGQPPGVLGNTPTLLGKAVTAEGDNWCELGCRLLSSAPQ